MSWLIANTAMACLLALLALGVGRFVRPAPAVMHGLWLLVVLKLITPPLFEVPLHLTLPDALLPAGEQPAEQQLDERPLDELLRSEAARTGLSPRMTLAAVRPAGTAEATAAEYLASEGVTAHRIAANSLARDRAAALGDRTETAPSSVWISPARTDRASPLLRTPMATPAVGAPTVAPPARAVPWTEWLAPAWAISALLLLVAIGIRSLRSGRRLLAGTRPAPQWLRHEVEQLAAHIGVKTPRLCDAPNEDTPYVVAWPRTVLVLPADALARCDNDARAAVLAHELAHLYRRDHWLLRIDLLLKAALFWHPLFWLARARMQLWAELACDAVAVRTVPGSSLAYATLLVDAVAEASAATADSATPPPTHRGPCSAALAWRPAARAAFERRLKMILNDSMKRRASRVWCLPFAALTLGLFALPVAVPAQGQGKSGGRAATNETMQIEIRVNGKPVRGLSEAQRMRLLKVLGESGESGQEATGRNRLAERAAKLRSEGLRRDDALEQERAKVLEAQLRDSQHAHADVAGQLAEAQNMLRQGLAEARREIESDDDLRELGITDEVSNLLDGLAAGRGIEQDSINSLVREAMKGAGGMIEKELAGDSDLSRLGLDKALSGLVRNFLGDRHNQEMVADVARQSLDALLHEVTDELNDNVDLRRLGIADHVRGFLSGKGQNGSGNVLNEHGLRSLVERAMQDADALQATASRSAQADAERAQAAAKALQGQHAQHELRAEMNRAKAELDRARAELHRVRRELELGREAADKARRRIR
ncbi:MAG: M56 family metallopeptidase [Planctomycetota bacterium]